MTDDPLDYMTAALRTLPADPARASLAQLDALHEGFARHAVRLADEMSVLERRTRSRPDDAELHAERRRLDALEGRTRLAAQRLDDFTSRALRAHGINLADFVGGDDSTRSRT